MLWILLFALLPLTAHAQWTFGPVRLDDSLAMEYSYPSIAEVDNNQLRCLWTSYSSGRISAFGQVMGQNGTLIGGRIVYEDQPLGQYTCAPQLTIVPLTIGGEARLFYHT